MPVTAFLAVLLMMAGVGGAAASDLQGDGKFNDRTLSARKGRHTVRKQVHHQIKNNILRSLDIAHFNIEVSPTSSQGSLPSIIRLYPPTLQPPHRHVNMPMRFGRDGSHSDDHVLSSNPNMPQRFGRSWKGIRSCEGCPEARGARNGHVWSLIRTLVKAQLLKTGLRWA